MFTLFSTAQVLRCFDLWKKHRIFNERTNGYVPICTILNEDEFTLQQRLQALKGILKCLFGLHARGLTQKQLLLEDIYIKRTHVRILSVFFLIKLPIFRWH